ncbi:uncharacterized protein LOC126666044 isoform X2 [Mercurialis annua]|nr:uncharacterized protein LOC126666044 isoform X2 [Mercurialis annua]
MSSSPSSTRKSERLEKLSPVASVQKKVETKSTPSPLRRSERGKKQSSSSSSGSKKLGLSLKKTLKRVKSVKQLTLETEEVRESDARMEKSILNGRAYRALFKQQQKKLSVAGNSKELNLENSCGGGASQSVDGGNESVQGEVKELIETNLGRDSERILEESNCSVSKFTNLTVKKTVGPESSLSSQNRKLVKEAHQSDNGGSMDDSKEGGSVTLSFQGTTTRKQDDVGETEKETLGPDIVIHVLNEERIDTGVGSKIGFKGMTLKRKSSTLDVDSDSTPVDSSKKNYTSHAEPIISSPRVDDFAGSSLTSFKKQRVNSNLLDSNLNQHINCASLPEDRGGIGGGAYTGPAEQCISSLQHKKTSVDFQSESNQNICVVCKIGGMILCCEGKGCARSYHLSCLDPPLKDFPPGVWYCVGCVRKKLISGVYSISDGVESIWDVKEVEVSDDNGAQGKQYLVKYKGLAHVHNQWLSENQLLAEAPLLLAKFNRKNEVRKWKPEWTEPHRLLQKRFLNFTKQNDGIQEVYADDVSGCHYEWLVKWHGLDYEHATWELEDDSFMKLPKVQSVLKDYENRQKKTNRGHSLLGIDKKLAIVSSVKSSQLPAGGLTGLENNHLEFIHNLLENWQKGQNAVLLDDQERMIRVIKLISTMSSYVTCPILIVTISSALSWWDEEFFRLSPSLDTVVYQGDKKLRKSIRAVEFYGGGGVIFDVLVTTPEVIAEDLNELGMIKWEAIIVEECQRQKTYLHFEQIKGLSTHMRLLMFNGQLKDGCSENLLSLLECGSPRLSTQSSQEYGNVKERLSKYVVKNSRSDSSRFEEYWVPVQISNMQLEQYCATLLSNSLLLCSSSSKNDLVGGLSDILISMRKCCDHPHIMDAPRYDILIKDAQAIDILDADIKASGKLQLLDSMLFEIRKRGLRVIVLFQSSGRKDKVGDILEDFARERFGKDSYERIDGFVNPKRKQAALNSFNNQKTRFVFLLETRACSYSVKLSSIDAVIIFGSDWSPENDLRNLRKISLDSHFEQLKIFRLYSMFTVEENVLILAKQDKTPYNDAQSINRATSQSLLMRGASYLFSKLDEFHKSCALIIGGSWSSDQLSDKDVIQDFLTILCQNTDNNLSNSSILKATKNLGTFVSDKLLPSEQKIQLSNDELPHIFWKKLLDGRQPNWKFSSGLSQRNRKRVQQSEDLLKKPEVHIENVVKKNRKVANIYLDPNFFKSAQRDATSRNNEGSFGGPYNNVHQLMSGSTYFANASYRNHVPNTPSSTTTISEEAAANQAKSDERISSLDLQKSLHLLLKPEIAKLCEILQLPENVKTMVHKFLEYVMNNHRVMREPTTILHAFQISLCWIAASLQKHKLDHKESLALAKQHLNFCCKKEEADYVYSVLRCLKKVFLYHIQNFMLPCSSETSNSPSKIAGNEHLQAGYDKSLQLGLAQQDYLRTIKDIEKKCDRQMRRLSEKQQEDIEKFNKKYNEEKILLEKRQRTEAAVIRLHSSSSMRIDKLGLLDSEYKKKFEELEQGMDKQRKILEGMHVSARNKMEEKKAHWLEGVKSWAKDELLKMTPPIDSGHNQEKTASLLREGSEISTLPSEKQFHNAEVTMGVTGAVNTGSVSSNEQNPHETTLTAPSNSNNNATEVDQQDVAERDSIEVASSNDRIQQDKEVSMHKSISNGASHSSGKTAELDQQDVDASSTVPETATGEIREGGGTSKQQDEMIQAVETVENPVSQLLNQTECRLPTECSRSQDGVASVSGNCNTSQPVSASQHSAHVPISEELQQMPSTDSVISSDTANLPSARGIEHQPICEDHITANVAETSTQMVEDQMEYLHQAVSQPVTNTMQDLPADAPSDRSRILVSDTRTLSIPLRVDNHTAQRVSSVRVPPLPLYHDPLQIELEKICKEVDQTVNTHEDAKLRLKSDCEKEMEEIRRKYDIKLQEAESEYLSKKKELDTKKNRVLMSKLLAEQFRSKCTDIKAASSGLAMQQELPTYMQQLVHLTSLNTRTGQRNAIATGTSPARPPSGGPQNTVTNSRAVSPSIHVAHPPPIPLSSGNMTRPHISSIAPINLPPPHLQRFRASSSPVPTNLSSSQQMPCSLPTSSAIPQPPIQQYPLSSPVPTNLSSSQQMPCNLPTLSPTPQLPIQQYSSTEQPRPLNNVHQPEISRISPPPVPELLMDEDNHATHPLLDLGSKSDCGVPPGFRLPKNTTTATTPSEVVCLSDDD